MKRRGFLILFLLILATIPTIKAQESLDNREFTVGNGLKAELNKTSGELAITKWDDEVSFKIKMPVDPLSSNSISEKELMTYAHYKVEVYSIAAGMEYEIIYSERPGSNIIICRIETKGLVFYYQPALTEISWPKGYTVNETHALDETGSVRQTIPMNVVGSYAVYHESKMNNKYKTGKVGHIYRPLIYDSKGGSIWGDLFLDEKTGILTITIPNAWLDSAVYPIHVDPTFGKTNIGGGTSPYANNIYRAASGATDASGGDLVRISAYVYAASGPSGTTYGGVYRDSDDALIDSETTGVALTTTPQWVDHTLAGNAVAASTTYWAVVQIVTGADNGVIANDWVGSGGRQDVTDPWGTWADPWVGYGGTGYHFSVYATYTSPPAGNNYVRSVTQSLNFSIDFDKEWNLTRAFSQDLNFAANAARQWTMTRVMIIGIRTTINAYAYLIAAGDYIRTATINLLTTINANASTTPDFLRVGTIPLKLFMEISAMNITGLGLWMDFLIENAQGIPIAGAMIGLWNYTSGILIVTEATNSTGYIIRQNMTIGDFTIQVFAQAYESHLERFTFNANGLKTIILILTEDAMAFNIEFLVFALLSLITFIGFIVAKDLVISVTAATLSFFCWSVTAIIYLYDNFNRPGPAILLGLFGTISLIYAIYAGMKLLDPYERERLKDGV